MKNKILFLGTLCLVLAFGLVFVGCDDGAQIVEFDTLGSPGNVNAVYVRTTGLLTVTWDAVDGANSYSVVVSQEGKSTYVNAYSAGLSTQTSPAPVTNPQGQIPDLDKWRAVYTVASSVKGQWKIGVIASSSRSDINSSDPAWAEAITF